MPARLILIAVAAALWTGAGWNVPPTATAAAPAGTASTRWTSPLPGPPTRLFDLGRDPFTRGQHRGVDLDATPGERVRSVCRGRVVFAGRVARAGTVSVRCGRWRVTYAPLARIAVRAGARVGPGRRLGRVADTRVAPGPALGHVAGTRVSPGQGLGRVAGPRRHQRRRPRRAAPEDHAGLHLGVRREAERFGYVDPLGFLAGPRRAPPPVVSARVPRPAPRATPAPRPSRPSPRATPAPRPSRPSPALAPWPVWVGLALLMTGLAGAGTLRFPLRKPGGAACRASSTSNSSPTTPSSP